MERLDDATFCAKLPKTELHAHVTGSVTPSQLHEIWKEHKASDPDFGLDDPIEVLGKAQKSKDGVRFFSLFSKYIYRLCNTKLHIQYCTRAVLGNFARDGVEYLELRSIPRAALDVTKEGYVQCVLGILNDDAILERPTKTYLILGVDRKLTLEEAQDTIDLAIKYKDQGVVGVDLSGNPTKSDVTGFADAYKRAKAAGLKITLHFAEGKFSSSDAEMEALLSYGPDRLGHVINEPDWAKERIRRERIGLEMCLTSNVFCELIPGGYPEHHIAWWRSKECPIAICSDDSGIFGSPTSHEYELVMEYFGLSRNEIIDLARSSISCIFGTEQDKANMYKRLDEFEKAAELQAS